MLLAAFKSLASVNHPKPNIDEKDIAVLSRKLSDVYSLGYLWIVHKNIDVTNESTSRPSQSSNLKGKMYKVHEDSSISLSKDTNKLMS